MATLKVNEKNKLEFNIEFNTKDSAYTNNTYLIIQHKLIPHGRSVLHFDTAKKIAQIDFSNADLIHNLNGEYELIIKTESKGIPQGSIEWNIGNLLVELSSGATDLAVPHIKGPLKGKEARHTFAPELHYAPSFISIPVAAIVVVLFIIFAMSALNLKIDLNNWPETFYGQIHAILFVAVLLALFLLYVYFWFYMRLLDLLPILGGFSVVLLYLGSTALKHIGDIKVNLKEKEKESENIENEEEKTEKVLTKQEKAESKPQKSKGKKK